MTWLADTFMAETSSEPLSAPPAVSGGATLQRILDAAHACFLRFGIDRTTMDDIAKEAKIARQTIYRHVPSKDEMVHLLGVEVATKINRQLRGTFQPGGSFADSLTEVLFLVVKLGGASIEVRYILHSEAYRKRASERAVEVQQRHQDLWGHMLQVAREKGELAADLTQEKIVYWLTLTQTMLLYYIDNLPADDDELREMIRRFIVHPLVTSPRP